MSIIRVSGGRQGKVNRVYGSSNYVRGTFKPKVNKKQAEKEYYVAIINTVRSFIQSKKNKNFLNQTKKHGNRLAETTLIRILDAYKETLLINGKVLPKEKQAEIINAHLSKNLVKNKVAKSTVEKILKYEPRYTGNKIISNKKGPRNKINSQTTNKQKSEGKRLINKSYYEKIIRFAYEDNTQKQLDAFVKDINKVEKLLSDSLVKNIVLSYKQILKEVDNYVNKPKIINGKLEKKLLHNGVHPETIKNILLVDKNYKGK